MTFGEMERAKRIALDNFDKWNDVTGVFVKDSGYYFEICGVIEDAVSIGAAFASGNDVEPPDDGVRVIVKEDTK